MHTNETIEEIIVRELRGLCASCARAEGCLYHNTSLKVIIQCDMFDDALTGDASAHPLQGLCRTCDHSSYCKLPGRKHGVWRCNEFQ